MEHSRWVTKLGRSWVMTDSSGMGWVPSVSAPEPGLGRVQGAAFEAQATGPVGFEQQRPIEIDDSKKPIEVDKPWALTGAEGRARNVVKSFFSEPGGLSFTN